MTALDRAMREKADRLYVSLKNVRMRTLSDRVNIVETILAFGRECAQQAREETKTAIADRLFETDRFRTWGETLDFCDKALATAAPTREEG